MGAKLKQNHGTETSSFGSPGRVNHDSSKFYDSRLYEGRPAISCDDSIINQVPESSLNRHYCHSSEMMSELPDNSVHLMITSPPYNVSKVYDNDLSLDEYLNLMKRIWQETYRVLVPGGRACINVANLGRKPVIPASVTKPLPPTLTDG